ncbi:hypothetical protein DSM110093_03973 (plasmid) [Sulfitobacter sp. DSM 110093]|nr:hypothetical protein DSM110093_03973 [Sulfitobacter sp. DSM 110093]
MAFVRPCFIDVLLLETKFCYRPHGESRPGWPQRGTRVEEIGTDAVIAHRRHRCASVGLNCLTMETGHVKDYHSWNRSGEEGVSGS